MVPIYSNCFNVSAPHKIIIYNTHTVSLSIFIAKNSIMKVFIYNYVATGTHFAISC